MSQFTTVFIPPRLDLAASLQFAGDLAALSPDLNAVLVDFSQMAWVEPFGMLVVAQAIQQLRKRAPQTIPAPINLPSNTAEGYATHVGFFDACAFPLTKPYGEAKGSSIYLPITRKISSDLMFSRDAETLGRELAQKLTQQAEGELVRTLAYSFCEIIRNVLEHSRSPEFWYCAQYWPANGTAEIALMDSGIGLRASLSNNPYARAHLTSDEMVLKCALMPGMSGRRWGKGRVSDDVWENTGYGLYMNYRICDEGGSFFIASGSKGLYRGKDSPNVYHDYHLPGVALRLKMRVEVMQGFGKHLRHQFLADAEREASQIEGGILPTGDKMSQMLRSGFNPTKEDL